MGQRIDNEGINSYINEAITNIRNDRAVTNSLLADLVVELKKSPSEEIHKSLGIIAAKYVETLQRSNEQLVKVTSILQKKEGPASKSLSEEDRDQIFDLIQEAN